MIGWENCQNSTDYTRHRSRLLLKLRGGNSHVARECGRLVTNNPMKTETPTINVSPRFSLRLAPTLVVAAVFILSVAAQATYAATGDLYESDFGSGNIYEFTPGGTRSTFA